MSSNHIQQWEFLNQISSNPDNTVVGIVRNKPSTDKRVAEELSGRSNITILEADLTSYDAVKVQANVQETNLEEATAAKNFILESC